MPVLRVFLLGPPAIFWGEASLPVPRRVQRALLFYLAARPVPVPRSELLVLFWPDEDETSARRHLREALSKLRASLPAADLLRKDQDLVWLDADRVYCDLVEFQRLNHQLGRVPWQLPLHTPLPEAVYQVLLKAVHLWRSPRFLDGVNLPNSQALDDWVIETGQQVELICERMAERLAGHAAAAGDGEQALHWLRIALAIEEFNEDLHLRVLNLLAEIGRRAEAIKYYANLQDLYLRELKTVPSEAIQAAYQRICREATLNGSGGRPGWPAALGMQVPFAGRTHVLSELKRAARRGGLVVISGEAGAGKSRLVRELFLSLEPAPRLLLAPARPLENSLPFQPLVDLLRHSVTIDDWQKLPAVWVGQLSQLLPELHVLRPDVPPPGPGAAGSGRAAVFEAVRQLLLLIVQNQGLLVFLDNAQWADEATLAAVAYLVERIGLEQKVLLLLAYRPEETCPDLAALLDSYRGSPAFRQVALEPLGEAEIFDLTRSALGQTPPPDLVRRLAQDTGGNPLFLLETLRAILDLSLEADLGRVASAVPLAGSLHALARGRLKNLGPEARQVLLVAAVLGNEFDPWIIQRASRLEAEVVVQALEELERVHLVRSVGGEQKFAFIHGKLREALLMELSPARRQLYRQRVDQALD